MKLKDEIDFSKETEYDHLAKTIREYDTIITFNWDVLLDDALGRIRYLDRLYQYEVESEPYHIKIINIPIIMSLC